MSLFTNIKKSQEQENSEDNIDDTILFLECCKAVDPTRILPNPWSFFGYGFPVLRGHRFNKTTNQYEESESYIYLYSFISLQLLKDLRKLSHLTSLNFNNNQNDNQKHISVSGSYQIKLRPMPYNTYHPISVELHERICAAK